MADLDGTIRVKKKKGSYFLPNPVFAVCNFDISLLPVKLNLPMVCQPLDWRSACPEGKKPRTLSDLTGGYLRREENSQNLCRVMNKLQRQAFKINSDWLQFILKYEDMFVEYGFLMPKFLASINISDVSNLLREFHIKDKVINQFCSFSNLLNTLCKNIQRAQYEKLLIKLATAYDGFHFDLPAFLDFRGRIYRSGVLHFHERDLARSLIVFADCKPLGENIHKDIFRAAVAFHYQSFDTAEKALDWFNQNIELIADHPFKFARGAKRPFQFLSNRIGISSNKTDKLNVLSSIPITQDASASAYQIMSYFLLDETLAKRTNLIPSGEILDIFNLILDELKEFMKAELEDSLSQIVCDLLNRKIVKGLFMPMIYGKTLMSTACDLRADLSHFLTNKDCFTDYMLMEAANIWIYDRLHKKRRKVTLRVASSKRKIKKTSTSTFVNFIHQKDAHIAMSVVDNMLLANAPIYTVHDNFISTAQYGDIIPKMYSSAIRNMGPPLSIINKFIYMNVIHPIARMEPDGPTEDYFTRKVISNETLRLYLMANVPSKISAKTKATFDERIAGILTSYKDYIRNVCGDFHNPGDCWKAHEEKWEKLKLQLRSREGAPYYCVHY
ncbi:probable DNA-directed RNA polymerase [Mercurialis annua]|uniref:probable DNA-directed RNA polymerase n=1 Tax=Mercurialis annua TaxID=3986 RepID=UPI0021602874|nr:probable DNA-directed RNA polymerase [Mercurialis annua]